jgi:ketosteroid isomerase-like protein
MTTNATRAATLVRALRASLAGDIGALEELYTDDVKVWAPGLSVSGLSELASWFERRDEAFSEIDVDVSPLDVGGDYACAEWTVTMTHSGRLFVPDGPEIEPTGIRVTINGATVAEFHEGRICSLRQYWDEFAALEQLGVVTSQVD